MDRLPIGDHLTRIGGGKTKDIFVNCCDPDKVIVRSRDDITAGDGARRDTMTGKAELSTTMSVNNFMFLADLDIPTHLVEQIASDAFIARRCKPIPIECVARRYSAGGSFPKRVTYLPKNFRFDDPVVEFFWKNDLGEYTDPLMVFDESLGIYELHPAKMPVSDGNILEVLNLSDIFGRKLSFEQALGILIEMGDLTHDAFLALEEAYAEHGLTVVDFKIEFGLDDYGGLMIIDVIDADSWRAWVDGDPEKALDKEYFRQHPNDPADLSLPAFRLAAELSGKINK